ncbi:S8 family serine peptidase [Halosimplex salinum]|uniref:S8 family serine peptidase n=1 Tax=Halosimplex salinum TaxID=1710538 RepID=UPI000F494045|nr:S8 family serine peptidase [Halosimplex salinum]
MNPRTRALGVVAVALLCLTAAVGALALSVPDATGSPGQQRHPTDTGLQNLHDAGITGENVTVGVVGVTGFDTDHPALAGRVAAARAFGDGTVTNGGRNRHGTATAAVLARTAPDADLYLATFDGTTDFRRAVTWLVTADVDVVVTPVSFYGTLGDGSAAVERLGDWARRQGTVFVAPTGNLARGHWRGRYDDVRDGRVRFDDTTRNYVAGRGSQTEIWLAWDRAHANESYSVELYRAAGNESRLVARSQPYEDDDVPNARINAQLEGGTYYVAVSGPANATGARLRLTSPTHRFQQALPAGSVAAPATGEGVVGVGAYDPVAERVEPFSSRGPTVDGRLGVDVVAPARHEIRGYDDPLVGSSAATPYVGGLAALLLDARPDATPTQVEHRLERTAVDVGPNGTDTVAGHGLVVPGRAVDLTSNATG